MAPLLIDGSSSSTNDSGDMLNSSLCSQGKHIY
jgi:hypothetical protein